MFSETYLLFHKMKPLKHKKKISTITFFPNIVSNLSFQTGPGKVTIRYCISNISLLFIKSPISYQKTASLKCNKL